MPRMIDLKEDQKEYICDKLCKWPCVIEEEDALEAMCAMCLLNREETVIYAGCKDSTAKTAN